LKARPDIARPVRQVCRDLARDVHRPALPLREMLQSIPRGVGPCLWLQLKALPGDLDPFALRQLGEGALEPPLADVAERADDVAPDLDFILGVLVMGVLPEGAPNQSTASRRLRNARSEMISMPA